METFQPVGTQKSQWGEGPIWWQDQLYYVDIENSLVIAYNPENNTEKTWNLKESVGRVGTVVPRAAKLSPSGETLTEEPNEGRLVVAGDRGLHFLNTQTGETTPIADPETAKADNRFNDGKCSPDGRFFAGTISLVKNTGDASLYRLDPDLSLHTAYDNVTNSNGIVWSSDTKTCYYIDTPQLAVLAFDYSAETGLLTNPRKAFSTSQIEASPDGMTIDSDGNLWIAFCHGACVVCFDPATGEQIKRVDLPCLETTACAFGGENLDELYVTTGIHKSEVEEHAGRLFCIKGLGIKGVKAHSFAG